MPQNQSRFPVRPRAAALAVTAALVLLITACGGSPSPTASSRSPSGPTGPTGSAGSSPPGGSPQTGQLAFARCMRSHGVTDFPDSGAPIQPSPGSDLNPGNPTYRAARQACQRLEPTVHLSPAEAAHDQTLVLEFAGCMRAHGITKYPDPVAGPDGNDLINLTRLGVGVLNSPQFQAAARACRRYQVPGGKEGP